MRIIGLEEHFLIEEIAEALGRLAPEDRDDNAATFQNEPLASKLRDTGEGRLREMDKIGLDMMVLSIPAPGTQALAAEQAVPLARLANDRLAAVVKAHPDRFAGFATLPTPDPQAAAEELERTVQELGFHGAMINGRTRERYLDHPDFRPLLGKAAELGVPIYLHPQIAPRPVRALYYEGFDDALSVNFATYGWGWHMDAGVAALRLILSGVFDQFPSLQIILGHWGEMVTFYLERADAMSRIATHLKRPVGDYFRHNFYVTASGMLVTPYLQRAVEVMGVDRVMHSSDYPFIAHPDGMNRSFLEDAPLSLEERHKIAHLNAESLLKLA